MIPASDLPLFAGAALQDVKARYAGLGPEATSSTPEEFGNFVRAEADKFGKIIKATGAKVD
jgi:tripartite-type tricarboxylate transporter receptor subunit TctC